MKISKNSFKILKVFYKRISLTDDEIAQLPSEYFNELKSAEFITKDYLGYLDGYHAKYTNYHITDAGKAYFQSHNKTEWLKQNWISLLAMLFAFISALPVIWQGILYILRCIM